MARTKWKPEQARRAGEQIFELLKTDRNAIEPRLSAGTIPGLESDVIVLSDKTATAVSSRAQKRAATKSQTKRAEELKARVMAVRQALDMAHANPAAHKAAGVGRNVSTGVVKSVLAGAQMIVDAYDTYRDDLAGAGILPEDIDIITALATSLKTTDTAQESAKITAKQSTAARRAAQLRVEKAITAIVGAAGLVFVGDSERLSLYQSIIPSSTKTAKSQKS